MFSFGRVLPREKQQSESRSRRRVRKAEISVVLKPPTSCPKCGKRRRRKVRLFSRTVRDLVFSRGSVKGRFVNYVFQTYNCRSCGHEYNVHEWYLHGRKWGWNIVAYFVYHIVGLRIPQRTLLQSMNRLYGCNLARSTMNEFKTRASEYYSVTKRKILDRHRPWKSHSRRRNPCQHQRASGLCVGSDEPQGSCLYLGRKP